MFPIAHGLMEYCQLDNQIFVSFRFVFLRAVPTNKEVFCVRFITMLGKQILARASESQKENWG